MTVPRITDHEQDLQREALAHLTGADRAVAWVILQAFFILSIPVVGWRKLYWRLTSRTICAWCGKLQRRCWLPPRTPKTSHDCCLACARELGIMK